MYQNIKELQKYDAQRKINEIHLWIFKGGFS
jgi:hypothetical protein